MRAAVLHEWNEPLILEELSPASLGAGEVRVRVDASGVCHSDLSIANGSAGISGPVILGHEGAGTVLEVGREVNRVRVGDRVIASFVPACGRCWYCLHEKSNLCESASALARIPRAERADGTGVPGMSG